MRGKYGVAGDPDYYPGTMVLRNKLGLRDERQLQDAESAFAAAAVEGLELHLGPFNLDHLCHLHRVLFGEVYDWAGGIAPRGHCQGHDTLLYQHPHQTGSYRPPCAD